MARLTVMCINHPDVCAKLFNIERKKRNGGRYAINHEN